MLTMLLIGFDLDYMFFTPAFVPVPWDLKLIGELLVHSFILLGVAWEYGLPSIFSYTSCNYTIRVPVVRSSGFLSLPLFQILGHGLCPSFPWILKNQHSENLECINTIVSWVSLASYATLSPKGPISSTVWIQVLPCSLKFIEGNRFPSPFCILWEMKLSTS